MDPLTFSYIQDKFEQIINLLNQVLQGVQIMSQEIDALTKQVAEQVTVEQSAVTLLNGLSAKISSLVAAGGSPAQFQQLATQLKNSADGLASAVAANTPAAQEPQPAKGTEPSQEESPPREESH